MHAKSLVHSTGLYTNIQMLNRYLLYVYTIEIINPPPNRSEE